MDPRRDDGEQLLQPAGEPRTSSLKRLACDACRARKVRCDRQEPQCSRCAKVGTLCHYSSRLRPAASKLDLSQFLLTLDTRLKQAEAKLASSSTRVTPARQPSPMMWEAADPPLAVPSAPGSLVAISTGAAAQLAAAYPLIDSRDANLNLHQLGVLNPDTAAAQQTTTECMQNRTDGDIQTPEFLYDVFAATLSSIPALEHAAHYLDQSLDVDFNTAFFDSSSSSTSTGIPDATLPSGLEQKLHERYFDIFHPIIPIINKTRFQAEIAQLFLPTEVRLLSYAMQALGTLSMASEQRVHAKKLYEQARYYLDVCERQEGGESLANINTLQACVLLTLYEFKRPNFARAWITLARAIRLAKIAGLDKPDASANILTNCGLREPPALPSTPAEVEERRRTFWVLYIFDAFASLTTKVSDFRGPILVPLPSPTQDLEDVHGSDTMPSLQQVFELAEMAELSPFAGTVIMISLYQTCFEHTESCAHNESYEFWDAHFRIDRALDKCRATLLSRHNINSSDGALSLGLRMNLGAVAIMLHEAMLAKVQRDHLPVSFAAEASSKCVSAVTDIVEAAQAAFSLTEKKLEAFRQVDRFLLWPVTAAIQVCFRMLYRTHDDAAPYIKSLRVLTVFIKDYIDPELVDPVLLQKVDERIAELAG